jgi:hypothetical protein
MPFTKLLTVATAALFATTTVTLAAPSARSDIVPTISAAMIAPAPLALSLQQQQAQPPKAEIKVEINDEPNVVWYTDPVWLAVGAIALLVIIVLAVMAARGGDRGEHTTVVR